MKTICIDAGNTLVKVAVAEQGKISDVVAFSIADTKAFIQHVTSLPAVEACIVSSVSIMEQELMNILSQRVSYLLELTAYTPIPIHNLYKTPGTLGKDRLAAVVGAHSLYPGKDILVIDAGTALTIDFIDKAGNYLGGNISPGLQMRFQALHDYTKRLPIQFQVDDYLLLGDTTASAITAGVQNGIIFEIYSYINHFVKQNPGLVTVMTGGNVNFFVNKIEKPIFAEPNLVFIGLEEIVKYNLNR